jgi:hypothetical protein
MVADNTSVNPLTATHLNLPFYGCFPHGIHLVVLRGMDCGELAPILVKMRAAKHLFKTSYKAREELQNAQKALNLPRLKLLRDMPVRWNTSYFMIDRYLEQKSAVRVRNSFILFKGKMKLI